MTQIWRKMRRAQQEYRKTLGIDHTVHEKHWEWMGDLSDKHVLDLGCYSGNELSLEIAQKSKTYLGIDLSAPAIEVLKKDLKDAQMSHAKAEAVDFLHEDFQNQYKNHFDVIYAHSVAHHFAYRPFQSDRDWEFPFGRNTFKQINEYFNIKNMQGIMGSAKWGVFVYLFNKDLGVKLGEKLKEKDGRNASKTGWGLWKCLQVTMCWTKN